MEWKIVLKGFFKNNWSQKTGNWEYVVRGKEKNRKGECLENRKRELFDVQERTRRERRQFFAKGKLMVVSTEWWHPVDIDQYAYRKLENIWPAFVIFVLVRCFCIFVCDICWITREAGEKRRTAKERAAILLAYFLLQYILSWKPFAWDMICTKFLVHYFSLMFSIFAEEIIILEVNNPMYGLTNVIWISWIRSTFKYLQYIFLLSITFNTGQPWDISAAKYIIPTREILYNPARKIANFWTQFAMRLTASNYRFLCLKMGDIVGML